MRTSTVKKLLAAGAGLVGLFAVVLWWHRSQFPAAWELVDEKTRLLLTKTLFDVGGQPVRVFFVIKAILFLLFLNLLARLARRLVGLLVENNPRIDRNRKDLASKIAAFLIYGIGILIGIQLEGISITTLAVVFGTLGLGVGFGLQTLVSNFVAGVILLIEQPIRIGDRIELGDNTGEVVRIGGRSSSIRTYDNAILIIPNSDFITKQVVNWTVSDPKIRVALPVSVAYGSNPEQVIETLLEIANSHADVMKEPVPTVLLFELGSHAMIFSLRVWTLTQANSFNVLRSDLHVSIVKRFKEDNIQIPFAQLDLHVKSMDEPVSINPPPH
jgi:small-conductance mechanosensitive channel